NFALATALVTTGPGRLRLGPHLSKTLTRLSVVAVVAGAAAALNQMLRAAPAVPSAPPATPAGSPASSVGSTATPAAAPNGVSAAERDGAREGAGSVSK
nr:hypothetical protein [Actinomycetota bacterium]